ncbi:MAG: hypothetical protein EZS28_032843 [Streblomastix strix]|uniref:Uncharacterized protein n=1 Tax=Streblomastix strix TaxID=222440 RepID=A0A5J4UNS5_9EUKA|nr:MAG: hypothetical protein EZS28_032843 [Streblomastix strix]
MKNKANWDSFVLTGCNADPQSRDGVWKVVAPLPTPPIEYAIQQSIAYGMYEQLLWGTLTSQNSRVYISITATHSQPSTYWNTAYTMFSIVNNDIMPKFSGTPRNIPLNAFMYNTKQPTTPVVWLNPIAIDCYIDPDGHIKINSICKYYLPDDFCVQDKWIKITQSIEPLAGLFEAAFNHCESLSLPSLQSPPCQALMGLGYHQTLS